MPWNGIRWTRAKRRTWFKASEVAAAIGVHERTVRNWVAAGKLTAERTPGGRLRFAASDIAKWLGKRAAV